MEYKILAGLIMTKTIYSKEHKNLIKKLIKARKEKKLSQKQVAEILGVTQSYVSKIESGQRRIDIVQLKKFANIYQKKISFFLEE